MVKTSGYIVDTITNYPYIHSSKPCDLKNTKPHNQCMITTMVYLHGDHFGDHFGNPGKEENEKKKEAKK